MLRKDKRARLRRRQRLASNRKRRSRQRQRSLRSGTNLARMSARQRLAAEARYGGRFAPTGGEDGRSGREAPSVEAKSTSNGGVLIARKGPVLSVETLGPRRITVGKEVDLRSQHRELGRSGRRGSGGVRFAARVGRSGRRRCQQRRGPSRCHGPDGRHGSVEAGPPRRQGTRAADAAHHSAAKPPVRSGSPLGVQASRLAGDDRGPGAETRPATGGTARSPVMERRKSIG